MINRDFITDGGLPLRVGGRLHQFRLWGEEYLTSHFWLCAREIRSDMTTTECHLDARIVGG